MFLFAFLLFLIILYLVFIFYDSFSKMLIKYPTPKNLSCFLDLFRSCLVYIMRRLYRLFLKFHVKFVYFLGKWVPNFFFIVLNRWELLLFGEDHFYPVREDDIYVSFYYNGQFLFRVRDLEYEFLMNSFFMSPFYNEINQTSFDQDVLEWMRNQRLPKSKSVDLWRWRDTFKTLDDFWEAAVYVIYPSHYVIEYLIKKLKWFTLGERVSQFAFESLVRYSCFLPKPSMRALFFQFLFSVGGLCFFFLRKFFIIPFFFILLIIFCYLVFLFYRYSGNLFSFIKSASFRLALNYTFLFMFPFLSGFLGLIYFVFRYLKEVFGYVYYYFFRVDLFYETSSE